MIVRPLKMMMMFDDEGMKEEEEEEEEDCLHNHVLGIMAVPSLLVSLFSLRSLKSNYYDSIVGEGE